VVATRRGQKAASAFLAARFATWLDHHVRVLAEMPRCAAYSRAVAPLRFHSATSTAHSAALRRAAFGAPTDIGAPFVMIRMLHQ
jgi:hypothetical protein